MNVRAPPRNAAVAAELAAKSDAARATLVSLPPPFPRVPLRFRAAVARRICPRGCWQRRSQVPSHFGARFPGQTSPFQRAPLLHLSGPKNSHRSRPLPPPRRAQPQKQHEGRWCRRRRSRRTCRWCAVARGTDTTPLRVDRTSKDGFPRRPTATFGPDGACVVGGMRAWCWCAVSSRHVRRRVVGRPRGGGRWWEGWVGVFVNRLPRIKARWQTTIKNDNKTTYKSVLQGGPAAGAAATGGTTGNWTSVFHSKVDSVVTMKSSVMAHLS